MQCLKLILDGVEAEVNHTEVLDSVVSHQPMR